MNKQQILGIVRHVLTTVGGVLITKGLTDQAGLEALIGGLVALVGVIWSVLSKRAAPTPNP
jgi:hypothetical protein